ncbi:hypothetical protein AMECASPLE_015047 [Ameca splendens]|uniref:Uncharacterized protein n=1 Tax=Ameca splendens TaxID=208324 RepID=A0ABV0ZME2_9TELE
MPCSLTTRPPLLPSNKPATTQSYTPPRSQVCGRPSLLAAATTRFTALSRYVQAIAPVPHHVRAVWSPVTADLRVGAVSTDPSLLCWGPDRGHVILSVVVVANHGTKQMSTEK